MGSCLTSCIHGLLYRRRGYETVPEQEIKPQSQRVHPQDLPKQFHQLYTLGKVIGAGTTSRVFEVTRQHRHHDTTPLACKVIYKKKLSMGISDTEHVLGQLRKEIDILRRVRHPNIVAYYDYLETKEHILIITERISGGELFEYLASRGPLTEAQAIPAFLGIFSAVAYLHDRGVIHRDIKAENIIFTESEDGSLSLKLIDFGFSTIARSGLTGSFLGTGGYIAPEIRQHKKYSTSVDDWALGILLYCSLSARLPFGTSIDLLPSDTQECEKVFKLIFPAQHWSNISEHCQDLISNLLIVDPILRMPAKMAIKHPWFQGVVPPANVFMTTVVNGNKVPFIELPEIYSALRRIRSTLNLEKKRTKVKKVPNRTSPRAVIDVETLVEAPADHNSKTSSISGVSDNTTKEASSNHGSFFEDLLNFVTRAESHHVPSSSRKSKADSFPMSDFIWDEVHDVRAGELFYSTLIDSANL